MLHVIIVGAGISGLTCAITLAKYTHVQVTVLERAAVMDKVSELVADSSSTVYISGRAKVHNRLCLIVAQRVNSITGRKRYPSAV